MRRTIVLIATVVAIGGLLAGCGDGDDAPAGTTGSATDQTASFPAGRYKTTADENRYMVITFNGGGSLEVEYSLGGGKGAGNGGSYVVDGDQITIRDHWCSQQGSETARYAWTWDGSLLNMTPVEEDGCADRQAALAEMTLVEPFEQLVGDFPFGAYESARHEPGSEWVDVYFFGDGSLMVENARGGSGGSYEVTGNTIEISDAACAEEDETASYEWALNGNRLTMTPLDDGCVARRTALAQMTQVQPFPPDQRFLW